MDNKKVLKITMIVLGSFLCIVLLVWGCIFAHKMYMNTYLPVGSQWFRDKKSLIVYFSRNDVIDGTAKSIQKVVGGDLYKLEPLTPYPSKELDFLDRLKEEKHSKNLVKLSPNTPYVKDYDVIYVGSPVINYDIAPIVKSYIRTNNFRDKVLILFTVYDNKKGTPRNVYGYKAYTKSAIHKNPLLVYPTNNSNLESRIRHWLDGIKFNRYELKRIEKENSK